MAYQVPAQWTHGDLVTAIKMQKYSDAQVYTNSVQPNNHHPVAIKMSLISTFDPVYQVTSPLESWMWHQWRWLWYITESGETATIVDPSGTNDDITLPEATTMTSYDMANVTWLTTGALYKLLGFDVAIEDWEGS